ncbi:MAG: hypothetical protein AAF602_08955 [Myxococcota bacterium]
MLVLAFPGCGPDLAEVETRQQALRREVDVLSADIAKMRGKMQEMGIMPTGPVRQSTGPSQAIDLGLTVSQRGEPPELPDLGPVERRDGTACGYRMRAVPVAEISDKRLGETGSGWASPLTVTYEGRSLEPHAGPARVENACAGAFRHMPRFVFVSPFATGDVDGDWAVGLVREQPIPRGGDDTRAVYWVYPGTSVTFAFSRPWNPDDGPFGVHLDGRLLRVGQAPSANARVEALGTVVEGTGERIAAPDVAAPDGPWSVTVSSPAEGPYVLLDALWVGNEEVGQVVSPVSEAG